jgi:hypothetical protein
LTQQEKMLMIFEIPYLLGQTAHTLHHGEIPGLPFLMNHLPEAVDSIFLIADQLLVKMKRLDNK